jgi:hypothetical protein
MTDPGSPPPHAGKLIKLPNGKGYVEVVQKPASPADSSVESEVAFYFYKDLWTTLSPAPSAGTLTTLNKKKVKLQSAGDALVTPPGRPLLANHDVDGFLEVELGGQTIAVPLGLRE